MKTHLRFAAILFAGLLLQPGSVVAALCALAGQAPCQEQLSDAPLGQDAVADAAIVAGPPSARDGTPLESEPRQPPSALESAPWVIFDSQPTQPDGRIDVHRAHGRHLYLTTLRLRL